MQCIRHGHGPWGAPGWVQVQGVDVNDDDSSDRTLAHIALLSRFQHNFIPALRAKNTLFNCTPSQRTNTLTRNQKKKRSRRKKNKNRTDQKLESFPFFLPTCPTSNPNSNRMADDAAVALSAPDAGSGAGAGAGGGGDSAAAAASSPDKRSASRSKPSASAGVVSAALGACVCACVCCFPRVFMCVRVCLEVCLRQ